jgi:hypothetical protein
MIIIELILGVVWKTHAVCVMCWRDVLDSLLILLWMMFAKTANLILFAYRQTSASLVLAVSGFRAAGHSS